MILPDFCQNISVSVLFVKEHQQLTKKPENVVNVKLSLQREFVIKELQMPFFSFIPSG